MIVWKLERSLAHAEIVRDLIAAGRAVPCRRMAILAAGLPGADLAGVLDQAADRSQYLTVSVPGMLTELARRGMIPRIAGLSPMEAADLAHGEAQYLAKRAALRAIADGRNLILEMSMASPAPVHTWISVLRSGCYRIEGVFADISIDESVRRTEAAYRRGHEDYLNGRGYGGRYIPPEAIRALADKQAADTGRQIPADGFDGQPEPGVPAGRLDSQISFPGGIVISLISAYRTGRISFADLLQLLGQRYWPETPAVCPAGQEAAAPAIDDPQPYLPGSFDDIVLAYDLGQLTHDEYEAITSIATGTAS